MACALSLCEMPVLKEPTQPFRDNCHANAGGQTPALQAGTMQKPWAVFYSLASSFVAVTLNMDGQSSKALLPLQQALAVQRAAQLQSSHLYADLLEQVLDICISLPKQSAAHSIPFEGFMDAFAQVKHSVQGQQQVPKMEQYVQEHQRWVEELQQELVR